MIKLNFDEVLGQIIAEGDIASLRIVLSGFLEPDELARQYITHFPRHSKIAARLVVAKLADLTDERILERLENIFKERPEVIRGIAKTWLESSEEYLRQLAEGSWPFTKRPIPHKKWWEAASLFLERAKALPRWEWFAQAVEPHRVGSTPESEEGVFRQQNKALKREVEKLRREFQACKETLRRERATNEVDRGQIKKLRQELKNQTQHLESMRRTKAVRDIEYENAKQRLASSTRRLAKLEAKIINLHNKLIDCQMLLKQTQKEAREPCPKIPPPQPVPKRAELQLPFKPEELSGVWIVPYASLAEEPKRRLVALIRLYEAALTDKDEPMLSKTNWASLAGRPSGVILTDIDKLLHDMISIPLARWVETSLFDTETYLYRLRKLVNENTKPLLERGDE